MRNAVYNALNKPKLLLGVERRLFVIAFMLSLIMFAIASPFIAAGFFAMSYFVARKLGEKDPKLVAVSASWVGRARLRPLYDSAKKG